MLFDIQYRNNVTGLLHSEYRVDASDEDAAKGVAAKQFNADLVRGVNSTATYDHTNFGVSVYEVPEPTDILTEDSVTDDEEVVA